MAEIKTKKCPRCGRVLPVSEFTVRRSSPDGYAPYCKECTNAYQRRRLARVRHEKSVEGFASLISEVSDEVIIAEFRRRGFKLIDNEIYKTV